MTTQQMVSPLIHSIILSSLGREKLNNLNKPQIEELTDLIIRYTFRLCDYKYFSKIKFLNGQNRNSLRRVCSHSFELFKFKLICLRYIKNHQLYRTHIIKTDLAQNKLSGDDIKLILFCANRYRRELENIVNNVVNIPTPQDVEKSYNEQFDELRRYANRITYKKLRFLKSSNLIDANDFIYDMLGHAARAYYSSVPYINGLHLKNVAKTAITNHAVNLIHHYTYEKRKRLYQDEDGNFVNMIRTDEVYDPETNIKGRMEDKIESDSDNIIVANTILKLYRSLATTPRRKTVFNLLILQNDNKFVQWYNTTKRSNADTTETIYERNKATFNELVRKFTRFKSDRFEQYVNSIRSGLR